MKPPILIFHLKTGKKYVIWKIKDFHTNWGYVKKEDIENAKVGDILRTHLGEEFLVLEPSFLDLLFSLKKGPQTTHWKDIGLILSLTGISDGWRVVELGTGSGILTSYLANAVKPSGHVYSYENRKEFYEIAKENLKKLGLLEYVDLKLKDVYQGIDETDVDLVVSDIRRPWEVLDEIYSCLKPGGWFIALFPNITSVKELVDKLREKRFIDISIYEVIAREWVSGEKVLRPRNMGLMHTEFIVLSRKI